MSEPILILSNFKKVNIAYPSNLGGVYLFESGNTAFFPTVNNENITGMSNEAVQLQFAEYYSTLYEEGVIRKEECDDKSLLEMFSVERT